MDVKEAKRIINYVANQAHNKILPQGVGLALAFQEKVNEATDFIAAGYPKDLTNWPFIHAESEALGITAKKTADSLINIKAEWVAVAAKIEGIRLAATLAIFKAKSDNSIKTEVKHAIEHLEKL